MRRVKLSFITLVFLAHLPASAHAQQQGTTGQSPAQNEVELRRAELADKLIHAKSKEELERLLAQHRERLTAELVFEIIDRGRSLADEAEHDQEAEAIFHLSRRIAEQIHHTRGGISALLHLGFRYWLQERDDEAIDQYSHALSLSRQSKDAYYFAESLRLLGETQVGHRRIKDGLRNLRESVFIGERSRDHYVVAWSSDFLADFYERQGNDSETVKHLTKAVEAFELLGDSAKANSERYNLAEAYYRLGNYRAAVKTYESFLPLAKEQWNEEAQANLQLEIYDCYVQLNDMAGVNKVRDQIVKIIGDLDGKSQYAALFRIASKVSHALGNSLYRLSDYPSALKEYQEAAKRAEQIKDNNLLAQALKSIGNVHLAQGNPGPAGESYEQSLALITDPAVRANLLYQIGETYNNLEHTPEALKYYQLSLEAATNAGDQETAAAAHSSLSGIYMLQGNTQGALMELEESKKLYGELGRQHQVFLIANKVGMLHLWGNYFLSAARVLTEALQQAGEERDIKAVAVLRSTLADLEGVQGNREAAVNHLRESLRAYTEIQNKRGIANVQLELGRHYLGQNRISDAQQAALEGMAALRESYDPVIMLKAKLFLGYLFMRQRNAEKSLEYFQACKELALEENNTVIAALSQMFMGAIYYAQEKYPEALKTLEETVPVLAQVNNQMLNGQIQVLTGFIYQSLGRDDEALRSVSAGIEVIEKARLNVAGLEQEQVMFFAQGVDAYRTMVQLHVKRNNAPEALFWAERAKARVLLDVMQHGAIDLTAVMSRQERERMNVLESRVAARNVQLLQENRRDPQVPPRSAALTESLEAARRELQDFSTGIYVAHPELRRRIGDVPPLGAEDAAELLPDAETALLEYVVTDEEVFLFVLTREPLAAAASWKVYRVELTAGLLLKIILFSREVSDRGQVGFKQKARELYDLLLKPAQEQLRGRTSLVIVPDGILWGLPFQALQTPANRYLLEDYAVSYAPSLAILREARRIRDGRRATPRPDSRAMLFALGDPSGVSPRLPETLREVNRLSNIYGQGRSRVFVRTSATEERFKVDAGRYRIVHLATHGLLDDSNPMYSQLMLAQFNKRKRARKPDGIAPNLTPEGDGLLEAREVIDLRLKADLVVLSACETARGKLSDGEGLIGLTWAFFVAGVPTTVASQWKVESQSTTELMLAFHEALKPGMLAADSVPGTAKALRSAALKLMRQERYRHPYYWAGFVVMGDGR